MRGLWETAFWQVCVAILESWPESDPLVWPLLPYIVTVCGEVGRPMLMRAIHQAKPEGEESMLSLAAREWIAEGKVEGEIEGLHEGQERTLLRLLAKRLGPVSDKVRTRVAAADLDALDDWLDRVLDAPMLEAVFEEGISY